MLRRLPIFSQVLGFKISPFHEKPNIQISLTLNTHAYANLPGLQR
jgi:hypothetical protein